MARVFITGSTTGLGRAAALALLDDGHQVVLHARSGSRSASLGGLANRALGVVIGDLASADQTHAVADQVNAIGRMDAADRPSPRPARAGAAWSLRIASTPETTRLGP